MPGFIKQVAYQEKKPVSIEREDNDVIVIEGVKYDGDYFRTFGAPDTDVLYAVQRLDEGCVRLVIINNVEDAEKFFEEISNA